MAKDNLSEALIGLKEVERKRGAQSPNRKARKKRGRPKAFDPFYLLCTLLMLFTIFLQFIVIAVFA